MAPGYYRVFYEVLQGLYGLGLLDIIVGCFRRSYGVYSVLGLQGIKGVLQGFPGVLGL